MLLTTGLAFAGPSAQSLDEAVVSRISAGNLKTFLEEVAKEPHVAGSAADLRLAHYIEVKFREHGLKTETAEYDVLLSYPEESELELIEPSRRTLAAIEGKELPNATAFSRQDLMPWNAYSPLAEVTAQVVYANFGRPEDFKALESMGVDVRGKIVLTRYGQGYRGGKSLEAERRGAAAILFYSDPAQDGYFQGETLPKGPWGPSDHFQRGANVYDFIIPGDPLTPGWPSTKGARRIKPEEAKILPKIPSLPISYADASPILEALSGPAVPQGWQGGLPFTYHIGPGAKVRLKVKNRLEVRRIVNVLGRIDGSHEPEKLVILSSHHDAWTRGAMDDGLGTAALLELSRVFGELAHQGLKPRRTLLFASWDAEEYTLTGSTEWGEEHAKTLKANAVALLNLDAYRWGSEFTAIAVPSLKPLVLSAIAQTQDPSTGKPIVLKTGVGIMGSGSDYTVFLNHLGVPAVETMFTGIAGAYHSIYDDPAWVEKVDPGLRYLAAMSRIIAKMALGLADSEILPLDYAEYARDVRALLEDLQKSAALDLAGCIEAAKVWETAAAAFAAANRQTGFADPPAAKALCANAALMQAERALLSDEGIPGRPWFKHLIYAPRPSYEALSLPGVREAVESGDLKRAAEQAKILEAALLRAAKASERAAACLR